MKPPFAIARGLILPVLFFQIAACDGRRGAGENQAGQVPGGKAAERATPPESAEHRRVREMLESVIFPRVEFEKTSAEEATDYVEIQLEKLAPAKLVKIQVRRPMPAPIEGMDVLTMEHCYMGHDFTAENISAWQLLERVASDNRMSVEVNDKGVRLMPLPENGKPVELLPLEEELTRILEERRRLQEEQGEDKPIEGSPGGFELSE